MANRVVAVALRAEIGQYVAGMSKAAASTSAFGSSVDGTAQRTGRSLGGIGTAGMVAGGLLAAGFATAVSKSMEFETAMSAVAAATGATASGLEDLRETAMRAGAATQYSAKEAADAITEMSKAGVSAADIMGGGLDGALSLAAAGQLAVADAAEIASVAMTQFGLAGADLPHVADLLAAGAGKALGSVDDLGQALNQAGLIADAAGLSIEETTGGLAAFASAGLIGSDAGTSFKTMLQSLQAPSGKSAELMAELGLNMYDAQGNMLGLADMAGELQSGLSGLTEEQRNSALATIFGSDAVRAANVLYREGSAGIEDWTRQVNDQGYAADQAAKLNDNLKGDLERLGGAFDTLMISFGSGTQGPLRMLTQGLTGLVDIIGAVVGWFADLPTPVTNTALAMAAVYVAAGPLKDLFPTIAGNARVAFATVQAQAALSGGAMGLFTGAVGAARVAIGGLLTTLAPFAVIAAAVGAITRMREVAGSADEAREHIDELTEAFDTGTGPERYAALAGSLDQVSGAARDANNRVSELENMSGWDAFWSWDHAGDLDIANNQLDAATEALEELDAASARADQSIGVLARRYNMTRAEVEDFAEAHGVDLSGSLQIVQQDFIDVADASGLAASGVGYVSDAAGASYTNLATYAEALGMSDDEMEELRKHTDELGSSLADFVEPLGVYTGLIDAKKQAEQESAQATADATEDQSDSWEDYVGDVSVSIDEYLLQLEEQVAAQDAWQANMLTLAGRVSQGTLDELARMGPEGAPLVADLVNASDGELARLETVFGQRSANAASEFGEQLLLAQPVLSQIAAQAGQGVADSLAQQLAAGTTTVAAIAAQYGIVLADGINPVLASLGRQAVIPAAPRAAPGTAGRHADGGAIHGPGSGTSDSIPAMLSNGEFVIRASSVDKYGLSLLNNINQGRAMFSAGGFVSTSSVPKPSSTAPFGSPISTGADATMQAGYDAAVAWLQANLEQTPGASPSSSTGLGARAMAARQYTMDTYGITNIGGFAKRNIFGTNTPSKHSMGKAIDIMNRDLALGWQMANFFAGPGRNQFGVDNVIWQQSIASGGSRFVGMADRGSPTQNHRDHVHVDFLKDGGLVGSASNPHIRDAGGPLLPGYTFNGTGRNEMVLPSSSREFSGSSSFGGGVQATTVNISGAEITGTLQMGGDGFMRIVDGRIVQAVTDMDRTARGRRG